MFAEIKVKTPSKVVGQITGKVAVSWLKIVGLGLGLAARI